MSYATNLLLVATWYTLLGPLAFFFLFVPASVVGFLHLVHFNWSTHNAFSPSNDFRPINIDTGYYKIGNLILARHLHAREHHQRANLFNPARMKGGEPLTIPGQYTELSTASGEPVEAAVASGPRLGRPREAYSSTSTEADRRIGPRSRLLDRLSGARGPKRGRRRSRRLAGSPASRSRPAARPRR